MSTGNKSLPLGTEVLSILPKFKTKYPTDKWLISEGHFNDVDLVGALFHLYLHFTTELGEHHLKSLDRVEVLGRIAAGVNILANEYGILPCDSDSKLQARGVTCTEAQNMLVRGNYNRDDFKFFFVVPDNLLEVLPPIKVDSMESVNEYKKWARYSQFHIYELPLHRVRGYARKAEVAHYIINSIQVRNKQLMVQQGYEIAEKSLLQAIDANLRILSGELVVPGALSGGSGGISALVNAYKGAYKGIYGNESLDKAKQELCLRFNLKALEDASKLI